MEINNLHQKMANRLCAYTNRHIPVSDTTEKPIESRRSEYFDNLMMEIDQITVNLRQMNDLIDMLEL